LDYLFDHNHLILPFSILFAFLALQFAGILPMTIGVKHRRTLWPMVCRPLAWLVVTLSPVVDMVYWINRLFIGRTPLARPVSLVDELQAITALIYPGFVTAHFDKTSNSRYHLPDLTRNVRSWRQGYPKSAQMRGLSLYHDTSESNSDASDRPPTRFCLSCHNLNKDR
tara:strand:+ start:775 stop:1278 length:504 start_codon:yes stop_codon:yes gene_type:complete